MISIVLPTYNGSKYIQEAMESIIDQSYKNWELIVVNDCSTDNTLEIVNKFAQSDSRIKVHSNTHNLRLPAALNVGFKLTSGEYLTWTSDDNILMPDCIEKLSNFLKDKNDTGLVFSRMQYIDGDGKKTGKLSYIPKSLEEIKYRNIVGLSFMYRRCVYDAIGDYDTTKFLVEDYNYWMRIARQFKIQYYPEVLYSYRTHSGSLTETYNKQVQEVLTAQLEEELTLEEFDDDLRANIYKSIAEACFSSGNIVKMKYYIKELKKLKSHVQLSKKIRSTYWMPVPAIRGLKRIKKFLKGIKARRRF